MDDDDFRRGRPTSHRVFGEAMAILAGDALLTRAFEIMAVGGTLEPVIRVALIRELAAAAGSDGMVGGQVVDMESEGKAVDRETVLYIHRHKTGALITAAVRLGAISAGADRSLLGKLTTYGRNLGAAFQIVDDLLDEEGDLPSLGKTPGSDRRKGKATWPAVAGVEDSRREAAALAAKARRALAGLDRGRILTALIDHVLTRRS
jgi:geranylgeranyl pyrophosphate synthase